MCRNFPWLGKNVDIHPPAVLQCNNAVTPSDIIWGLETAWAGLGWAELAGNECWVCSDLDPAAGWGAAVLQWCHQPSTMSCSLPMSSAQ